MAFSDSPPFAYVDASGQTVGFDVDLMDEIAQEMGFEVTYMEVFDWHGVFTETANGRYDAVISAASITPQREQIVDFSEPYFQTGLAIAVRQGSDIRRPSDLAERRVGIQQGTTGEIWVEENVPRAIPVSFQDGNQAFEALAQGDVDGVVHDELIALGILQESNLEGIELLDELVTDEAYGIAVRGDRPDLLMRINQGLTQAITSGQYDQFCTWWFGNAGVCQPGVTPTLELTQPSTSVTATSPPATAPSPEPTGRPYVIEAGDWLSEVAEREYDQAVDYRAIVYYTNLRCPDSFDCIDDPNVIRVGMQVYLPSRAEVAVYWEQQLFAILPPVDAAAHTGEILVVGSSTVEPLTRRLADRFAGAGFAGSIQVEGPGTGTGFERFCGGEAIDIVDASRPIEADELADCRAIGREPVPFQIGTDGLPIVVNAGNTFATDVTVEELVPLFSTALYWSDVRPEWPHEPILRFTPGEESGTFDYFVETVFAGDPAYLLNAPNLETNEDDNVLVQQIADNPYAIGFFGYAYYRDHRDRLRALAVEGVEPRQETVDAGTYPLMRPLFIYTTAETLRAEAHVAAFVNFYLRNVKHEIEDVGYFMPDQAAFEDALRDFAATVE